MSEDIMIQAIFKAHEVNQDIIKFIDTIVAECGESQSMNTTSCAVPEELFAAIKGNRHSGRDGGGCIYR